MCKPIPSAPLIAPWTLSLVDKSPPALAPPSSSNPSHRRSSMPSSTIPFAKSISASSPDSSSARPNSNAAKIEKGRTIVSPFESLQAFPPDKLIRIRFQCSLQFSQSLIQMFHCLGPVSVKISCRVLLQITLGPLDFPHGLSDHRVPLLRGCRSRGGHHHRDCQRRCHNQRHQRFHELAEHVVSPCRLFGPFQRSHSTPSN